MKLARPDLAAYALAALCVVGIIVCAALKVPAPDFLTFAGTTALGIGGGVSLQGATTAATEPAPAAASVPAPRPAAPQPLTSEPATGVFRAATHAP